MADNTEFLQNLKGTTDFLPEEQIIRNFLINNLRQVFELYGYLPVETPILNHFDLLSSKYAGGAEILKEVYKLTDQGGRSLGLRYDLTVPFAKIIASNQNLALPFKRYEIGKVFRNGPVKVGRSREFYQCDIDVCGVENELVEVEFFQMIFEAFKRFNTEVIVEWNNRKFLSGIIEVCNIPQQKASSTILSIDKLEKIGKQSVQKELKDNGISLTDSEKLFSFFDYTLPMFITEFANTTNENLKKGLIEVQKVATALEQLGLSQNTRFVPFLARGLEIYTGTVWEIFDKQKRLSSSLGGGGRYDRIITEFIGDNNIYPAVGMSFGLEPIYELIKRYNTIDLPTKYDFYLYTFDYDTYGLNVAQALRQQGFKTLVELRSVKLKKALDYANKQNIRYVIIIGEDERNNNTLTVKDMTQGTQQVYTLQDLIAEFSK